jgi:hypothetical protein
VILTRKEYDEQKDKVLELLRGGNRDTGDEDTCHADTAGIFAAGESVIIYPYRGERGKLIDSGSHRG